jgi:hypothetical protein
LVILPRLALVRLSTNESVSRPETRPAIPVLADNDDNELVDELTEVAIFYPSKLFLFFSQ